MNQAAPSAQADISLSPFGPLYLDQTRLETPDVKVRKGFPLPGTFVPQFRRVGAFWIPDMWLYRPEALEDLKRCPVRGRILRAPAPPPIDYELVLSLGELMLADFDPEWPQHVTVIPAPHVYGLECVVKRFPDGSASVRFDAPRAVVLVPRRTPLQRGDTPDLRDFVEIICVFENDGAFLAAPLEDTWRFAAAWGPDLPTPEALLRAMQRGDAAGLSPPDFYFDRVGQHVARPLGVSEQNVYSAERAQPRVDFCLLLARHNVLSLSAHPDHARPTPVVEVRPCVDRAGTWLLILRMKYGELLVPPDGAPHNEDEAPRTQFIARDLIAEDRAIETLTVRLGESESVNAWLLDRGAARRLMADIDPLKAQGWQFELANEFYQAFGARLTKRPHGLAPERVFRHPPALAPSEDAELVYQQYVAVRSELSEQEALDLALAVDEHVARTAAAEAEAEAAAALAPPVDEEATRAASDAGWRAFARALGLSAARQPRVHLSRLVAKVAELRRLREVQGQDPETLESCISSAEQLMRDNGARLLAHQRDALRGILHRLYLGRGAILALPVGYGKTLVALLTAISLKRLGIVQQPILWIGTKSTLVSLRGDLRTFLPALRCGDYTGPGRAAVELDDVDLVMSTYDLLRLDAEADEETRRLSGPLHDRHWGLLVLDEYSVASNPVTSTFDAAEAIAAQADRVLLLNATLLENTTVDLWSHLQMVSRGTYGDQWSFAEFDRLLLDADAAGDRARAMVRRDVFAYTVDEKQCSEEDVHIPPLIWRPDLEVENTPEHAEKLEHYRIAVRRYAASRRTGRRVIGDVGRLRRACHRLSFLGKDYQRFTEAPRANLVADLVAAEFAQGNHTLVFCTWTDCVALVEDALRARGLKFDVLRGETSQADRAALAHKWGDSQNPPPDTAAMLIQPVAGGRGLNLTAANRVVFTEPFWNPGLVRQNVGRAHRIRQTRTVEAQMIVSDAVMERAVRRRAQTKAALTEAVFGGGRLSTSEALRVWVDDHRRLGGDPDAPMTEDERLESLRRAHAGIDAAIEVVRARFATLRLAGMSAEARRTCLEDLHIEVCPLYYVVVNRIGREVPADEDEIEALYVHQMALDGILTS